MRPADLVRRMRRLALVVIICGVLPAGSSFSQNTSSPDPIARFEFDGSIDNSTDASVDAAADGTVSFVGGLDGEALSVSPAGSSALLFTQPCFISPESAHW